MASKKTLKRRAQRERAKYRIERREYRGATTIEVDALLKAAYANYIGDHTLSPALRIRRR